MMNLLQDPLFFLFHLVFHFFVKSFQLRTRLEHVSVAASFTTHQMISPVSRGIHFAFECTLPCRTAIKIHHYNLLGLHTRGIAFK